MDGFVGEACFDGEQVGEVSLEGGDYGRERRDLGGWGETLVFFEGVTHDAAVGARLEGQRRVRVGGETGGEGEGGGRGKDKWVRHYLAVGCAAPRPLVC